MADKQQIATAQANGSSTGIEISRFAHIGESHLRTLFVGGTFDSAIVKYQLSPDSTDGVDGNWFDVADADAITAAKVINVEHRAMWHRINVASGLGSEAIDAWVV
ncbi:hypothetical protein LCGC14_3028100, partial [marine sediment metagenome]